MRGRKQQEEEIVVEDPTAWLINSVFAEVLLLMAPHVKYMAMFCYTFVHGSKLFKTFDPYASPTYKFVSMIFQCTGGGILVPVLINSIPVPLAQDAYPIAIMASFLIHNYLPIIRDVMQLSPVFKIAMIVMYETMRASVVVKLTTAAGAAIAPSDFSFPVFGPIMCGSLGGCGGAFLPLNKGLDPIKNGLGQPMISACIAATVFHLFLSTSLSDGVQEAAKKGQVLVAVFFIAYNLSTAFPAPKPTPTSTRDAPGPKSATASTTAAAKKKR